MAKKEKIGGSCDGCPDQKTCKIGEALSSPKITIDTGRIFSTIQAMRGNKNCILNPEAMESTKDNFDPILESLVKKFGIIALCSSKAKEKLNFVKKTIVKNRD
jgi:hypothetical protein